MRTTRKMTYLDPEHRTIKVCEKPFMCIHIKWVGFFNTINVVAVFWTYTCTTSICSIHMEPHSIVLGKCKALQLWLNWVSLWCELLKSCSFIRKNWFSNTTTLQHYKRHMEYILNRKSETCTKRLFYKILVSEGFCKKLIGNAELWYAICNDLKQILSNLLP